MTALPASALNACLNDLPPSRFVSQNRWIADQTTAYVSERKVKTRKAMKDV